MIFTAVVLVYFFIAVGLGSVISDIVEHPKALYLLKLFWPLTLFLRGIIHFTKRLIKFFKKWCEAIDKMDYTDRKAIANQIYGHYNF